MERQDGQGGGGKGDDGSGNKRQTQQWFPSNSILSGWQDLSSKMDAWSATAPDGQSAYCGTLQGSGSLLFQVCLMANADDCTLGGLKGLSVTA